MSDTLWGLFAATAARVPDAPALEDAAGTPLSYAALATRAEALAAALLAAGVHPGARVVTHLPRGVDEVVALLAIARLGAVLAPLHAQHTPAAVARAAAQFDAACVLTEATLRDLAAAPVATRIPSLPPAPTDPDALAAVFPTSGSTGPPKGVMHRHAALVRCARDVAGYLRYAPDERLLALPAPAFHYGFNQLWSAFSVGATVLLPAPALAADLPTVLAARRVTGVAGVPLTWVGFVAAHEANPVPLPTLRFVTNAGGALAPDLCRRLAQTLHHVRVHLLYGLTEALRTAHLPPEDLARAPGALGRPVPGAEVLVVDGERLCGPDEPGELVHRGPTVARGYWGAPGAPTFRAAPELGLPADEIVCFSGDRVRRDADGILWFLGRTDGLIKSGGFRIGPGEVEAAVLSADSIASAVAFGAPDPTLGEAVEVAVTTPGDAPLDRAALRRACRAALPAYMVPRRVHHWRGAFPLTPTGKPARAEIVRACLAGAYPGAPDGPAPEVP